MPTIKNEGTITTTASEQTLATNTDNEIFQLLIDTANLQDGDSVELRLYTKVRSSSTERIAYFATYSHSQGEPNKYSVPVPSDVSFKATIKRASGTDRSYDWKILAI